MSPATPSPTIFVKSGYEYVRVELANIRYLRADADYTEIVLTDKKVLATEPLKYWEQELPGDQFVRVHKSYIVHTGWIEKVMGNQIYLAEQQIIPIGRAYKEAFFQKLER